MAFALRRAGDERQECPTPYFCNVLMPNAGIIKEKSRRPTIIMVAYCPRRKIDVDIQYFMLDILKYVP